MRAIRGRLKKAITGSGSREAFVSAQRNAHPFRYTEGASGRFFDALHRPLSALRVRARALRELVVHQLPQRRLERGAARIEKLGDASPWHFAIRLEHGCAIHKGTLVTGIDRTVRKTATGPPRQRVFTLSEIVAKLKTDNLILGIQPHDEFEPFRLEPTPFPRPALLSHVFDFV